MRQIERFIVMGGLTAALLVTGVTGCASWNEKKAKETGRTAAQLETDNRISDLVKQSLATAPIYKFQGVGVTTYRNTVQLNGFVGTDGQKRAAEGIAKGIPGVNRVINDIAIVPQAPEPTGRNSQGNQVNQNNQLNRDNQPNQGNQVNQDTQSYQAPQVTQPPETTSGSETNQTEQANPSR